MGPLDDVSEFLQTLPAIEVYSAFHSGEAGSQSYESQFHA